VSYLQQRLSTGIPEIIESILLDLHTVTVGKVVSFDGTTQRAAVQPCIQRKLVDEDDPVNLPQLNDVLVVYPGTGGLWLVGDIAVDSYVVLLIAERSLASWKAKGDIVDPELAHRHDLSDAIAIGGIWPTLGTITAPASNTLSIRNATDTVKVEVATTGVITIENAAGSVVLSATGDVTINGGSRKAAGENHTITANATTDPVLFTWFNAVATATGVTPAPTSITGKISQGESTVLIP
jgi:hypothetical protein